MGKDVERQYGMKVMTMIDTTTTARSVIIVLVDTSARASTRCTTCCSQSLSEIERNDMNYLWGDACFRLCQYFSPTAWKKEYYFQVNRQTDFQLVSSCDVTQTNPEARK